MQKKKKLLKVDVLSQVSQHKNYLKIVIQI